MKIWNIKYYKFNSQFEQIKMGLIAHECMIKIRRTFNLNPN